jgi:2-furoyl-CoA dehydrogenase large subunit
MIAPVALANAICDATGIEDLEPPFLPGRVWEKLQGRDPDTMLRGPLPSTTAADGVPKGSLHGKDQVDVPAPQQVVWDALLDPDSLKAVIPGCESVEITGPETYRARVRISVVGISATYQSEIRIFDRHEPASLRLSGRARGRLGFGEGEALVTLTQTTEGHTRVSYEYGANVGGRLAGFGHRMLDGVVRVLLATFFERLRTYLRGEKPGKVPLGTRLRGWMSAIAQFWRRS